MQIQVFVIENHINFPSEKSFFRRLRQLIFFFFSDDTSSPYGSRLLTHKLALREQRGEYCLWLTLNHRCSSR